MVVNSKYSLTKRQEIEDFQMQSDEFKFLPSFNI